MTRSRMTCALLLGALWVSPALAQQTPAPAAPAQPPTATAPAAPSATTATGPTATPGTAQDSGVEDALGDAGLKRFFEFANFQTGLTSQQVADRAVKNSALVEQRQATARAAQAQEDEATSRLWPKLTLSARYTRLSPLEDTGGTGANIVMTPAAANTQNPTQTFAAALSFPSLENQYELKASLSVPVSDYVYRTNVAIEAAEHSADAARYNEESAKRDVAANARLAYYDWVQALGQQIVAEEALANFQSREKDAKVFYQAGTLPKAQLLGSQAQTKNAEVQATRAKHHARIAEERLRTITYDKSPAGSYRVGEDLRNPPPPTVRIDNIDSLVSEAQGKRSEFKAINQQEQAITGLVSLAKSENYPRLDVTGNYLYGNPNQRYFPQTQDWHPSWDVSAVLSWTPTDTARANAVTAQQQAKLDELHAQRRQLVENLRLEVTQAVQGVEEADATLGSAREALAAAEESYRGRRELFRIGQGSLVDLNDAEVALTRARLEVINAHIDARTSRVRLEHALGRDALPQAAK